MVINRVNKMTLKPASKTNLGPAEPSKTQIRTQLSQTRIGGGGRPGASPGTTPGGSPSSKQRRTVGGSVSATTFLSVNPSSTTLANPSENRSPVGETAVDGGNVEEENANGKLWRKIFTIYFIVYSVICFLFILSTAIVWGTVSSSNLKYFISRPDTTPFFHVEIGTTWMVSKFLLGSVIHMVLAWSGVSMLSGGQCSQQLISKSLDKFKIFLWLGVIAVVGDFIMFDATLDYIISSPIVQNGDFLQTIRPPAPAMTIDKCVKNGTVRPDPNNNPGMLFLRINLNWFVEVLCGKHKENSSDVARWEFYFKESQEVNVSISEPCKLHLNELEEGARDDCANALYLYHTIFAWLGLTILGIFFAFSLFYLNGRLSVKLSPIPRFSFAGMNPLEAADLEYLRTMAEKVRNATSWNKKKLLEPSSRQTVVVADGPA